MTPRQVVVFMGTRPEAIKLCPVILHMQTRPDEFDVKVCATAQHREMLDQVLALCDQGLAIVFISSELAEVLRVSHRVAVLRLGDLVELGPK